MTGPAASATVRSGAMAGACARGDAATAGFGAVLRLRAGLRAAAGLFTTTGLRAAGLPAVGRRATAFGAAVRTLAGAGFGGEARRGALDLGGLALDVAGLALAFDGFGVGAFFLLSGLERVRAACAALARFLACLAIFLLAFANFRARLSTSLAARSARFTAPARAAAFFASAFNRCAAAACLADVADKGAVATTRPRLKEGAELSPPRPRCHLAASVAAAPQACGNTRNRNSRISAISAAQTACAIG